jgi:hypothetical protein
MLSDQDTGVARTAALALSGRPEVRAQAALTKALDHREPAIRRCAADAIARWSGETIDPASPAVERRRTARRIAETLARMEENALREAMAASPATAVTINQPQVIIPKPMTEEPSPAEPERPVALKSVPAARPVESPVEAPKNKPSPLEAVLIGEIRTSLRGRTAEELSQLANTGITAVTDSLALLVRQGTLSQRGPRFFVG